MKIILPVAGARPAGPPYIGHPLLALGFRPFFLLAGGFAALAIPLWLLELSGRVALPLSVPGPYWHGHEMIFGFTLAVVAGFLLTAVRNWTQQTTPAGKPLLALAAVWLVGRLGLLFGALLPVGMPAVLDLVFLPALIVALSPALWKSRNRRNYGFVAMLGLLWLANLLFHFGPPDFTSRALRLAVDVVIVMITVMGGRVVPMFTRNAVVGTVIWQPAWLEKLTLLATLAVMGVDALAAPSSALVMPAAGLATACHALRLLGWGGRKTGSHSLLWVLHLGYAWIPLGFLLRMLTPLVPSMPATAPLHALTVGAIGMMTLGMMARVSLGHTGRLLVVGKGITVAFGCLALSTGVRVLAALLLPTWYLTLLMISGTLWAVGFLAFVWVYSPILLAPRADGRPG